MNSYLSSFFLTSYLLPLTSYLLPLRPKINVVGLDLRIQRRGIHAQQSRRARLMPAGLIQRPANQIDFEPPHFIIEINSAAHINR